MVRRKPHQSTKRIANISVENNNNSRKQCETVILVDKLKKKRNKSRILQEIRILQKTTKLLIPRIPFARLVREIINDLFPKGDYRRIQFAALEALQESAEVYIVQFLGDAMLLALHGKRVTLMKRDMVLLRRLRGRNDIINK